MTKFVQLGEKKKGRIVKNEQYTIEHFETCLQNLTAEFIPREPTKIEKLLNLKYYRDYKDAMNRIETKIELIDGIINWINVVIDLDSKGRKNVKK